MITYGSGFIVSSVDWTGFKAVLTTKPLSIQYADAGLIYQIFAIDGTIVYDCQIWKGDVPPAALSGYSQAQNDADKTDFETNYKPTANQSLDKRTTDGRVRFASEKPDTSKKTAYSVNWANKTTWYHNAIRVVEEVATDSGDHILYNLANTYVIDTYHGKITQEDFLVDDSANSYRVVVTVDDVEQTEQDPHTGSGDDYTVNYTAGSVSFVSALTGSEVVKVTYHYATDSEFIIAPEPGKKLALELVEAQFSADLVITDSLIFQPYGYVDVFAPHLTPSPFPSGTKIPLGDPLVYKTMYDYMNDALRAYPPYPADLGGASNWRGIPHQSYIFDWDYVRATTLLSSYGMEIRIKLQHDIEFGGTYGTGSFYCSTENE